MASAVRSEPRRIDAGANGRDDEQGIDLTPSLGAVGQGQRALQSCPNASIHQHTTELPVLSTATATVRHRADQQVPSLWTVPIATTTLGPLPLLPLL